MSTVIDWNQASALLGPVGEPVSSEMNELFREMEAYVLEGFQELAKADLKTPESITSVTKRAHQLRGSMLNFGFTGTASILLSVETQKHTPKEITALIKSAKESFISTAASIRASYPDIPS